LENFIEINENSIFYFEDWIYDAIINKLLKNIEEKKDFTFYDLIYDAKRENISFISIKDLDIKNFHDFYKLLKDTLMKREKNFFTREKQNIFMKKCRELLESFYNDDRFYKKYD
jgi:hypothetical protein